MSILQTALDYLGWGNDLESERSDPDYDYDDGNEDFGERRETGVIPFRQERSEFTGLRIIRADPKNMDQATCVADEIKQRKPVLLNLQSATEPEAKRIRDFIGGVTYGLDGYMRRIADWVYICAPFDMPVEKLMLDGTRTSEPRYESADRRLIQEL